ncbi:MAG: putative hemolysin [Serratia sp. (in: enterobacteria)]|uniref:putative hemolysin n=1 Tax=Serratia sp. (in: enterobacteria) TaxID=616 RepID=UPI003F2E250E
MTKFLMLPLFVGVALLQGCTVKTNNDAPPPPKVKSQTIGMANPADVYCVKIGGKLNPRQNAQGQYSTCTLPSGQEIDSWELFRRDHPVKK